MVNIFRLRKNASLARLIRQINHAMRAVQPVGQLAHQGNRRLEHRQHVRNAINKRTQLVCVESQPTCASFGEVLRVNKAKIKVEPVLMIDQRAGERLSKLRFAVGRLVVMRDESS